MIFHWALCIIDNRLSRSSTSVSLKAREVLILGQMPSYEERLVQMESVLKNSVSNHYYGEQGQGPRYCYTLRTSSMAHSLPLGLLLRRF